VPGLPAAWAVLDRRAGLNLVMRVDQTRHELAIGTPCTLDGVELVITQRAVASPERPSTIAELATMLADAESP
jgi:hypothetical protein